MPKKFNKTSGKTSPEITNALNTAVTIVSKVAEIGHYIATVGLILLAIFSFTGGAFPGSEGNVAEVLQDLNTYGLEVEVTDGQTINFTALGIFSIGAALITLTMAFIFRNIYLITKSTHEKTPFTEDNMRMLKELGIFFIAIPVIGVICSGIIHLVTDAETSMNCDSVIVGLIMLYLTQIFAHGVELEDDVKDLV